MDSAVTFVGLEKNFQFKSVLNGGGEMGWIWLFCSFTAFCKIYLLLCSSHWLLKQMVKDISFIPNCAMLVERVNQEQNSHSIPLCFAHFMLMLSL